MYKSYLMAKMVKTCIILTTITLLSLTVLGTGLAECDSAGTMEAKFRQTIGKTTTYILHEMKKADAVGLSIALVSDDRLVWSHGFGWADKENRIPAKAKSVYMLGSGTKTFTATAILKLHEQGLLDLDRPVADYIQELSLLPRYNNQMGNITVRRMLNHHSGIPGDLYNAGFLYEPSWNQWGCDLYIDWLLGYLAEDYPTHRPGEIYSYSNIGFVLSGEAALRVGGRPGEAFQDYLEREIFSPLGMKHTSLFVIDENLTKGYVNGQAQPVIVTNCTFGATGGAYTTVNDMARFLIMVINGGLRPEGSRFLLPETAAMFGETEQSTLDIDSVFKAGLALDTMDDAVMRYAGRAWLKSGGTGDYFSLMGMLPDKKLGVIVLSNSNTAANIVWGIVRECLKNAVSEKFGLEPSPPTLPVYNSVDNPSQITGLYVKKSGYDLVADKGDGSLNWTINAHAAKPEVRVLHYQGTGYIAADHPEIISFQELQWQGDNHFVMIQSGSDGLDQDKYIYGGYVRKILGEKFTPQPLPGAWTARLGVYIIDNMPWNTGEVDEPFFNLSQKDDLLLVRDQYAALVEDDATAFVVGLSSRSDSSIRAIQDGGMGKLLFGGYRMYPLGTVPQVFWGQAVKGTVALFKTDWYRFEADAAVRVSISIGPDSPNYSLGLFDQNGKLVKRDMGLATATVGTGTYYIGISPTPDATGTYELTVVNQ